MIKIPGTFFKDVERGLLQLKVNQDDRCAEFTLETLIGSTIVPRSGVRFVHLSCSEF